MKIMSIDYGDARTGVAFCDKNETLAFPFTVIKEKYRPNLVEKIVDIIHAEKPEKIVIGLPRNMDGSYGYRCDECKQLGDDIKNEIELPVDYQDERLTTVIAHNALSANHVKGKKRKENIDSVSAVIILQSYIDKNKS